MAEADPENVPAVISAAKRHSDMLARNLSFFDQAEVGAEASNAAAIETLRRLRAWELHNAGLAWRDIEVPFRSHGAVDAHLTNLQQYLTSEADADGEPTFDRLYDGCPSTPSERRPAAIAPQRNKLLPRCWDRPGWIDLSPTPHRMFARITFPAICRTIIIRLTGIPP